ncbi:mRNA 3'-end-processing protein rna-14 [Pleurostoma richardsiae]|uniref:mRNA 3'-end-processing protein RNA14 n=1 Tax=Pleurostoma richardsiae TaxID=41990 RepID=A0AA38VF97_9PEZI|nr:mRNA 3'-end-processing protein rna-14 [Pleurostoma richardsiae]
MATEFPDPEPVQAENAWAQEMSYNDEDVHASHFQQGSSNEQEPDFSVETALHGSGDSAVAVDDEEDSGEYDPESVSMSTTPQPLDQKALDSKPAPQPIPKKPRTAGGFIVGDSDSEDEDATPASSGPARQDLLSRPHSRSPLREVVTAPESVDAPFNGNKSTTPANNGQAAQPPFALPTAAPRLPLDTIGVLEDRIKEDPRGAMDAWIALLAEHRRRNKIEDARAAYERFLAIFPHAAEVWVAYMEMEIGLSNFQAAEALFGRSLLSVPNVQLWTVYLDYIRRRNDLSDTSGQARQTVTQAYEFVLDNVGIDKDSGKIWSDYIQFIRYAPGQIGGSSWQDQQKMDQLRKAYQRAVCVPISNVNTLWRDYDQFEMSLNKMTGRKFLAERSPAYMSAKSANTALDNITRGLIRTSLPRLPPAPGFEGDQEYMEQVEIWKKWVAWEKSDPLDLKDDEPALLQKRILHCYKQALMALRFWPEMWVEAAEWCFENNIIQDGKDVGLEFLLQGIEANPESVLLALKHADRIEMTYPVEEGDDAKVARGSAVRAPYQKVLDTLYDIIKTVKEREKAEVAKIEEAFRTQVVNDHPGSDRAADDDDEGEIPDNTSKEAEKQAAVKAIQQGFSAQTQLISRTLSFVWIALARAMRRIQGKGAVNAPLGGLRQVFTEARQRGRLTSDVYVAVALLEWNIYKDIAGAKIFERGAKLFPEDENFMIEYLKFLHSRDDFTNARVVFETCVNRLTQTPELVHKAKPLYAYFHKYESQYGELSQIAKLEKRMAELFPEDPKLAHFNARFSADRFDPIAARIIVSPTAQLRPKAIMPSIEQRASVLNSPRPSFRQQNSPRPQFLPMTNSPKRPFPGDEPEDLNPPRKLQRGESPLKGAAGRRLDQQRRMQGQSSASYHTGPAPISRDITFLLGLIPPASSYESTRFNPNSMPGPYGVSPAPQGYAPPPQYGQPPPQQPPYGRYY